VREDGHWIVAKASLLTWGHLLTSTSVIGCVGFEISLTWLSLHVCSFGRIIVALHQMIDLGIERFSSLSMSAIRYLVERNPTRQRGFVGKKNRGVESWRVACDSV
jgi:hypothetical protein